MFKQVSRKLKKRQARYEEGGGGDDLICAGKAETEERHVSRVYDF